MAHKTTKEENYSGLTEEGFEQWTVSWDEFFDFISEHNGEKIDVTIDEADVEKVKAYFAEYAEGETCCEDFFEAIENLGIEGNSLVLRFPNGLNHLGEGIYGEYFNSFPNAIAKIYLPPTFWARWREIENNKELFVVPSNYTYVTSEEEEGCDELHQEWPKFHYNNELGEEENCCKTYHTDVKHFPAGKYSITLIGGKYNNELEIFYGDDATEIAQAMIDDDYDALAAGVHGPEAKLYIKNYTTGQTWTLSGENADGDTTASLWIDDVMPCFALDVCYFETESYSLNTSRYISYNIGGHLNDESDDSEKQAETFENGFNWGDIKIIAYSMYPQILHLALVSVCGNYADDNDYIRQSCHDKIQILGESYDWDEVEDMANGGDYGDDDEEDPEIEEPTVPNVSAPTPPQPTATPTSSGNTIADMNASLKASLEKTQAELKNSIAESQAALKNSLAETQAALKKSLEDAMKGLK